MFEWLVNVVVGVLLVACVALIGAAIWSFRRTVTTPDRTFMDPLSWRARAIWPLVVFVAYYFGRFLSTETIERTRVKLMRAGMSFSITPEQFFALRIVSALLAVVLGHVGIWLSGWDAPPVLLLVVGIFGYFIPALKLTDSRKRREREIVRMLPTYLDFITMAVEAGLSLAGALVKATASGPDGLLKHELERVNREIRAGAGRTEALEGMAQRLDLRELTQVVSALAQAEKTGSSIGDTLRIQADQQRVDRFQRAEKKAMEAPVKLIFPLVAFIFPTTFIVLGFPIVMRLIHGI